MSGLQCPAGSLEKPRRAHLRPGVQPSQYPSPLWRLPQQGNLSLRDAASARAPIPNRSPPAPSGALHLPAGVSTPPSPSHWCRRRTLLPLGRAPNWDRFSQLGRSSSPGSPYSHLGLSSNHSVSETPDRSGHHHGTRLSVCAFCESQSPKEHGSEFRI